MRVLWPTKVRAEEDITVKRRRHTIERGLGAARTYPMHVEMRFCSSPPSEAHAMLYVCIVCSSLAVATKKP